MNSRTKLSAKGQVVIPKDVRERLGLAEGTEFEVLEREGEVVLRRQIARQSHTAAEALRKIQAFYRYDGPALSDADLAAAAREAAVRSYLERSTRK